MDPFLPLIAALSVSSLALLLYNTLRARLPAPAVEASPEGGGLKLWIEGRPYKGYVYVARRLPQPERDPGRRIVRIARDVGASVTVISSLYKVPRDAIVSKIEAALGQLEAAYAVTRSARLRKQLEAAERLLDEIAGGASYWGALALIVWAGEGPEGVAQAEAFRALVEADLGVRLEAASASDAARLLAPQPSVEPLSGVPIVPILGGGVEGYPVVLGWQVGLDNEVVSLSFPEDFEAHVGVVGPTGRGKTVLLAGLASQLGFYSSSTSGLTLVVIDPKGDLSEMLSSLALERVYSGAHPGEYVEVIRSLWEEQRRSRRGRVAVIVDEAWRLMRVAPELFEEITREGRSLGFHLVYAVQEPGDIPRPVADNTATYIVFGGSTRSYASEAAKLGLEGLESEIMSLPVGEAILARRGSRPLTVRVINFAKLLKPARHQARALGKGERGWVSG